MAALGLKNSSDSGNNEESSDGDPQTGAVDMGQKSPKVNKGRSPVLSQCCENVLDNGVKCQGDDTLDQQDSVKQWQQNHFGDDVETKTYSPEAPGAGQEVVSQYVAPPGGRVGGKETQSGLEIDL